MPRNFPRILLAGFLVSLSPLLRAQPTLNIGYGMGMFTHAPHNLQVLALAENEVLHPYWDNKVNVNRMVFGPVVGFTVGGEKAVFYMMWQNRHNTYSGGGVNPATGTDEKFSYKLKLTHLSIGALAGVDGIKVGASMDFGRFKPYWKYDLGTSGKTDGYVLLFDKSSGILSNYVDLGSSVIIQLACNKIVSPRIIWYSDWFGVAPDYGLTSYFFKASTLSVDLVVNLHKKS